ncbi:MAG: ATP-dependent metalloprotease [Legionellales bacterium]|nr:ATP-dependent metalloprotease [Legionellales bacterium]
MNEKFKNLLLWFIITAIMISVFSNFGPKPHASNELPYSQFIQKVSQGEVKHVTIQGQKITGESTTAQPFISYMPMPDNYLLGELIKQNVSVKGTPPERRSLLMTIFLNWFPMLLLIGVWLFFMRQMQGGGSGGKGPMSFGGNRAKMLTGNDIPNITFKDVAGVTEAKQEVSELVEFLKDPSKFQKLGGKIPCGSLLVGPPGTGKTLLAKAVAGEANVPFFSISGSDFVEMFVGVGASRVRNMFEQAKKQAPCIIFIDEIDAVGRQRGAGLGGGHDEREQTLNQLLVEMDGFEGKEGVIVMAATNRPDVLDPALLRPGRFDRQVYVPLPDILGRTEIIKVYLEKVVLGSNVDAHMLARGTPGFSGADLSNLVNEAALLAARNNSTNILMEHLEAAKDKIMMGAERRSMAMSDEEKRITAYHEAGHAIVGLKIGGGHDPVYKVSIIPRGRALGVTMFLPQQDRLSMSLNNILGKLCSLYGGRIAEELIFGEKNVTTGASNDIEKATELARNFVTRWGLNKKLGPINYANEEGEVFLGRSMSRSREMSDTTAHSIDVEVKQLIDQSYKKAEKILKDNMDTLHRMADALMLYETIDETQIADLMAGKPAQPPAHWEPKDTPSSITSEEPTTASASQSEAVPSDPKPKAKRTSATTKTTTRSKTTTKRSSRSAPPSED